VTGTVVIAGRAYAITRIRLAAGKITISCAAAGPQAAVDREPATVFGDDGTVICQGWAVSIPEVPAGARIEVVLPLVFQELVIAPDGAAGG
jgi:hypothetical protein